MTQLPRFKMESTWQRLLRQRHEREARDQERREVEDVELPDSESHGEDEQ